MGLIEIEIVQWAKHQPRKDIKHPSWFALNNRVLEDPKLFDLSPLEWKALFYIFCQASQQNSSKVVLNTTHAARVCEIPEKSLRTAINKLTYAGVTSAYANVTDTYRDTTLQDTTEQNKHNTIAQSGDFADFWFGYPRKVGKGKAEKAYLREIKAGVSHDTLCTARDRYRAHCEAQHVDAKYIKHGSTFMAEWKDWLDPETGQSESFANGQSMSDAEYAARERAIFEQGAR